MPEVVGPSLIQTTTALLKAQLPGSTQQGENKHWHQAILGREADLKAITAHTSMTRQWKRNVIRSLKSIENNMEIMDDIKGLGRERRKCARGVCVCCVSRLRKRKEWIEVEKNVTRRRGKSKSSTNIFSKAGKTKTKHFPRKSIQIKAWRWISPSGVEALEEEFKVQTNQRIQGHAAHRCLHWHSVKLSFA